MDVIASTGVLKGKRHRALDSTVLDDAAARQDTITQLIAGIRRFGREVPGGKELLSASRGRSVELHPEHALMREHRAAARDEGYKPITHSTGAWSNVPSYGS